VPKEFVTTFWTANEPDLTDKTSSAQREGGEQDNPGIRVVESPPFLITDVDTEESDQLK
jgi:hypothetical protein